MPGQRAASLLSERPTSGRGRTKQPKVGRALQDNTLVRLLVLDKNPKTPQQIENALWIWPHKITTASTVKNAVKLCQHLSPAALIVSLDFPSKHNTGIIGALREEIPKAAIIAVGTAEQTVSPGPILDLGANAVITREELQRPTLHDLLIRIRNQPDDDDAPIISPEVTMALPWRDSQIVGSLVCDIKGTVTCANDCLATWLDYPEASALHGKCIWRDILNCPTDWTPWKTVAGDMTALLHHSVTVKASNDQLLWMCVEVFASPNSPTDIQAIFVDQSELAHLTGRSGPR